MNKISTYQPKREGRNKSERQTIKLMQTLFMKDKLGKSLRYYLWSYGERIYVEMEKNFCEGLLK